MCGLLMKTPALTGGDDLLKESGLGTSYIILLNKHTCTQAQGPGGRLSDFCELGLLTLPSLYVVNVTLATIGVIGDLDCRF